MATSAIPEEQKAAIVVAVSVKRYAMNTSTGNGRKASGGAPNAEGMTTNANVVATARAATAAATVLTALLSRAVVNERNLAAGEIRDLREELGHASRVTMVGELAAGLAHQYHQPLTAISAYADAAMIRLKRFDDAYPDVREPLEKIASESVRAAGIVDDLKDFLRKREPVREKCSVEEIVRNAVRLGEAGGAAPAATVSCSVTPGIRPAVADPIQLTQVVVNLIANAREAIAGSRTAGGRVGVFLQSAGEANYRIVVEDNGPGMDAAAVERCFEQFYTTKADGLGVGLGISKTLVEAHGGTIVCQSRPRCGTRFEIVLPYRP